MNISISEGIQQRGGLLFYILLCFKWIQWGRRRKVERPPRRPDVKRPPRRGKLKGVLR